MDFRQLEAFCAIIEWGSFSEACKKTLYNAADDQQPYEDA